MKRKASGWGNTVEISLGEKGLYLEFKFPLKDDKFDSFLVSMT